MLVATPAGQPPAKAEKFATDVITYAVNCASLLDKHELIQTVSVKPMLGISFPRIRSKKGTSVEVTVTNDSLTTEAYRDFLVQILLHTTFGNTRAFSLLVRAYK